MSSQPSASQKFARYFGVIMLQESKSLCASKKDLSLVSTEVSSIISQII
jgi:hypothetical protein